MTYKEPDEDDKVRLCWLVTCGRAPCRRRVFSSDSSAETTANAKAKNSTDICIWKSAFSCYIKKD